MKSTAAGIGRGAVAPQRGREHHKTTGLHMKCRVAGLPGTVKRMTLACRLGPKPAKRRAGTFVNEMCQVRFQIAGNRCCRPSDRRSSVRAPISRADGETLRLRCAHLPAHRRRELVPHRPLLTGSSTCRSCAAFQSAGWSAAYRTPRILTLTPSLGRDKCPIRGNMMLEASRLLHRQNNKNHYHLRLR